MTKNYYVYSEQYSLSDVYYRIKRALTNELTCAGLFLFLDDQQVYYTIHFTMETAKTRFCMRVYLSVDETYMNMFYLQTSMRFIEISAERLTRELTNI